MLNCTELLSISGLSAARRGGGVTPYTLYANNKSVYGQLASRKQVETVGRRVGIRRLSQL